MIGAAVSWLRGVARASAKRHERAMLDAAGDALFAAGIGDSSRAVSRTVAATIHGLKAAAFAAIGGAR